MVGHASTRHSGDSTNQESDFQLTHSIDSSCELLNQLVDQFRELRTWAASHESESCRGIVHGDSDAEVRELRQRVAELRHQLAEAERQNQELSSKLPDATRDTVTGAESSRRDALSWEDRKELILTQMEEDTFDAEAFIATLQMTADDENCDPIAYVEQLHAELQRRDEEIERLRCIPQQIPGTQERSAGNDAAAMAEFVDADELVREEREKLRKLQAEWEERFRAGEIAASLERAKLSRERRELAQKNERLEEQLAHLRRQVEEDRKAGVTGARRWLAKLGLDEKGS